MHQVPLLVFETVAGILEGPCNALAPTVALRFLGLTSVRLRARVGPEVSLLSDVTSYPAIWVIERVGLRCPGGGRVARV